MAGRGRYRRLVLSAYDPVTPAGRGYHAASAVTAPADPQPTASPARGPARAWPTRGGPKLALALSALGALVLFGCYYRQSRTVAVRSDGGSVALQAWAMLHGNLLLRHWHMSDVSFWCTELVQYTLLEAVHGLGPGVVHLGGAMTYTLLLVLAAFLAMGRARWSKQSGRDPRQALVRVLIVVAVMVAPAAAASPTLLLTPDHLGSAVPVLLAWLAVDRLAPATSVTPSWSAPPDMPAGRRPTVRWLLPALVLVLLTWGQVADGLVLLTGAVPMAIVCGARALVLLRRRASGVFPWLETSLAVAALASVALAHGVEAAIRVSGGYVLQPVATTFIHPADLPHVVKLTIEGLTTLFGVPVSAARTGPELFFALVHLAGLLAVAGAVLLALAQTALAQTVRAGRPGAGAGTEAGAGLMIGGLAIAIVINVAAFVATPYAQNLLSAREIAAVLPFGAVLAGRQLAEPLLGLRRARKPLLTLLATVLVLNLAALGYHAAQPARPADNQALANWLLTHQLTAGLSSDYWAANSTTLAAGGRVTVRQISIDRNWRLVPPEIWGNQSGWYDPDHYRATFMVEPDAQPRAWRAEWWSAVRTFGRPARTLHADGYTVLVWHRNLLAAIR
jgi:hypothetical protein